MEADVNVSAHVERPKIVQFRFFVNQVGDKMALVTIENSEGQKSGLVSIQALIDAATATQKTTIRQFFKRIGVLGVNKIYEGEATPIEETDLEGEAF